MDFYTGKPDRAINHYGIISYKYQQSPIREDAVQELKGLFKNRVNRPRLQSDDEALKSI